LRFDFCLALRSPAFALYLALKSLDLAKGDGVLVSALSPLYYAWVIRDLGLTPVYCDVFSSATYINRETAEKALTSKSARCLVLHHTLGYLSETSALLELGLPIIEDHSQSYGTLSETDSAPEASAGIFTILGLEERDMLTSGGGALLYSANRRSPRSKDTSMLRNSENNGALGDLPSEYGLPGMNAAMAVVQFRETEKNLKKRRDIAEIYSQSALRTRHKRFVERAEYNNYAFPLILETGMKDVKAYARRKDIAIETAFENTLVGSGMVPPEQCPEAYSLSLRTVLFPIYPRLSMSDAGKVAKLILTLP
jgi:dTDP-4-amino-4,6-dideoxygalactose transaminase